MRTSERSVVMQNEHAEFLDHLKNERDVTEREAAVIGVYSIVIAIVFFGTVFALFTYFQWELDQLRETRINAVQDPAYAEVKTAAETGLAGAPVKVDDAMRALAEQGQNLPKEPAAAAPAPGQGAEPAQGAPGTPVLLVLGYYECPMLCSLVMNGAMNAIRPIDLEAGRDFQVVVVSIDPEETPELAKKKRANYLKAYGRKGASVEEGFKFHVAEAAEVKRLAEAVGFGYFFDDKSEQWAHGAGVFFLAPDGKLVRTLTGVELAPQDVKFALIDASNGKVGTLVDRIVMSCFHYEADAHKYGLYIWGAVRVAGLLILLSLGTLLVVLWRRERLRKGPAAL